MSASTNINKVYFNGKTSAYAERVLYQWDYGQVLQFPDLELPAAYQVHFSTAPTAGSAYDMLGTADGVSIPDTLLEEGKPIYAWIFLHAGEDDGETVRVAVIYVKPRSKSISETPTPAQQSAWDQAITALSAALEEAQALAEAIPEEIDSALAAAKASGEFDGKPGSNLWWCSQIPSNAVVQFSALNGKEDAVPVLHDYVFGPEAGTSGNPTTIYEISQIQTRRAKLNRLGSTKGEDGFAPVVTIETITGGHRVTITSAAHPEGQSFDVMDGQGGGGGITVDDEISATSENPVQNKVIKAALDGKYSKPASGIPKTDLAANVQASLDNALPKSGGTMTGPVDMGGSKISNLAPGTNDADAVTLSQMSSAISQSAAYFRGSFATRAALLAVAWQTTDPAGQNYVTNNDYAVVRDDETQNDECWRYLYVSGTGWTAQYKINETPLTQAQLDALNSGATASNISAIAGKITAPASANVDDFLVYTANGWAAQTVPSAQGVSF